MFLFCSYLNGMDETGCMGRPRMRSDDGEADPTDRAAALALLRERVRMPARSDQAGGTLAFGIADIDERLPGAGLALGGLHEVAPGAEGAEAAALGFTLALVARHLAAAEGEALLVIGRGHPTPYGHGLADLGLDPGRLLLFEVESDTEVYRAIEEALRADGLAAIAGLVDAGLPLKQSRRLHLAAERTDLLLLVLRPPGADQANAAATRWRVDHAEAARDRFGCIERACWRVELDRCRNGRTGHWLLEWDHAAHRFDLAGALAGHAAAPRRGHAPG